MADEPSVVLVVVVATVPAGVPADALAIVIPVVALGTAPGSCTEPPLLVPAFLLPTERLPGVCVWPGSVRVCVWLPSVVPVNVEVEVAVWV